jgi:hypothetical protein
MRARLDRRARSRLCLCNCTSPRVHSNNDDALCRDTQRGEPSPGLAAQKRPFLQASRLRNHRALPCRRHHRFSHVSPGCRFRSSQLIEIKLLPESGQVFSLSPGSGSSGTENRLKDSRYSLSVSSALLKGRSWPCATESGSANAYRPRKLMCSNTSGESRPTSSGFRGYPSVRSCSITASI